MVPPPPATMSLDTRARRASREWKLTAAGMALREPLAEEHQRRRTAIMESWGEDDLPVFELSCSGCCKAVCNRGLHVQLLADKTSMFSSDVAPILSSLEDSGDQEVVVNKSAHQQCTCQTPVIYCACKQALGYYLQELCGTCSSAMSSEEVDHRWCFVVKSVHAKPRVDPSGRPLVWVENSNGKLGVAVRGQPFEFPFAHDLSPIQASFEAGTTFEGWAPALPGEGRMPLASPLSDRNGRERVKCSSKAESPDLLAQVQRREQAVAAREAELARLEAQSRHNFGSVEAPSRRDSGVSERRLSRLSEPDSLCTLDSEPFESPSKLPAPDSQPDDVAELQRQLRFAQAEAAQERAKALAATSRAEQLREELARCLRDAAAQEAQKVAQRVEALEAAAKAFAADAAAAQVEARAARAARPAEASELAMRLDDRNVALSHWQETLEARAAALTQEERIFQLTERLEPQVDCEYPAVAAAATAVAASTVAAATVVGRAAVATVQGAMLIAKPLVQFTGSFLRGNSKVRRVRFADEVRDGSGVPSAPRGPMRSGLRTAGCCRRAEVYAWPGY